jgi:hypothetical protein
MKNKLIGMLFLLTVFNADAVTMFGDPNCAEWRTKQQVAKIWLAGYLTGMNAAAGTQKNDRLANITIDQAALWMDNFCATNPLKTVGYGAITLYLELDKK